jgi:CheY-like chemotaxis protein
MDTATINQIFDPYFTTKEKGEGTGMGLAVVHGIVKSYGGTIQVYSKPGKGSSFHIYLPMIKREAKPEIEKSGLFPRGNERILFVDNEEAIVTSGKKNLEMLGYQVVPSTDPNDALETYRADPDHFDLVVTDMGMPNMTGEIFTQELMLIRPDLPVILCTGYSERMTEENAKKMGIKAFIMKPVLTQEMATTIRLVLDQGKEEKQPL